MVVGPDDLSPPLRGWVVVGSPPWQNVGPMQARTVRPEILVLVT